MKELNYSYEIDWNSVLNKKNNNKSQSINKQKSFLNTDYKNIKTENLMNNYKFRNNKSKEVHNLFENISKNKNYQQYKPDYNNKTSLRKKFNISGIYYGLLFVSIFCFLFFLTISMSFASQKKVNNQEDKIFENTNSDELLNNYLFDDNTNDNNINIAENKLEYKKIEYSRYRFKKGDSLERIAKLFGLDIDSLILCNNIKKKGQLNNGSFIIIPNQDGRIITIKMNDSIYKIAKRYGVSWEEIADINNIKSENLMMGTKIFIPHSKMSSYEKEVYENDNKFHWPLFGKLTSNFGPRIDPFTGIYSFHTGIDIKKTYGSPVNSINEGYIISTGYDDIYGNFILIKHNNGFISKYGHLSKIIVKKGSYIKKDQLIAKVGSTGRSTGSHLHLEITKYGKLIDPLKLF